jgi:SRSO17 transposase
MKQTITELLKPYENGFSKPQFNHFEKMINCLSICDIPSINRFSYVHDKDRSCLTRFLTESPWKVEEVKKVYHQQIFNKIPKNSYLIIDDTLSHRPFAKKVEKVNFHFDHTNNRQSLGYCLVSSCLTIKDKIIPYDLIPYYREENCKDKPFISKNEIAKKIILSTKDNPNITDVIIDTWYSNDIVLGGCKDANKNYITQIKSNRKITIGRKNKYVREHQNFIYEKDWTLFEKEQKFRFFSTSAFISGIGSVHLIFCQMFDKKSKKWGATNYIISNKLNVESQTIIEEYLRRGGIEVFHREAKQNTGLEGYFLRKNRGIERYLFLVMLTYAILVLQSLAYEKCSIGKMCEENKIRMYETSFDLIQQKPSLKRCIFTNLARARI